MLNRRQLLFHLTGAVMTMSQAEGLLCVRAGGEVLRSPLKPRKGDRLALPSPQQRAWQDLGMGMFIHFAPNTWQDVESDDLSTPLANINPSKLDPEQWVATAQALGAHYIVFVAKHQGGFCMWQTQTTDYSIRNTPWKDGKGDVLAEISAACLRHKMPLGVYVCPRDDHFGATTGGICKTPESQAKYDKMYREQLTEVFSRYGELVEIWFDGSTKTPVGDLLQKYQPNAMIFQGPQATIRWVGNEDGFAPYPCWNGIDGADARSGTATALDSNPDGDTWLPNEVDVSLRRPDWFWSTKNAANVLTVDQLLSIYYRSTGRGAQLLLNIPANRDGLLDKPDCAVAQAFGTEIRRRFSEPVAISKGQGHSITLKLSKPAKIDTVLLQENTELGERVRSYRLEGLVESHWKPIAHGSAIGQKRIQPIAPETFSAVRFTAIEAVAEPSLRTFAVFNTGVEPPHDWDAPSELWSSNLVGKWSGGEFSLDLSEHIKVAAQYALQFKPLEGAVSGLSKVTFELGGVANPALIKMSPGRRDEVILDITGVDKSIHIEGLVDGAKVGSILLTRR